MYCARCWHRREYVTKWRQLLFTEPGNVVCCTMPESVLRAVA